MKGRKIYMDTAEKALKKLGLKITSRDRTNSRGETYKVHTVMMPSKNTPELQIRLWITPGGDGRMACWPVEGVPASRQGAVLEQMNSLMEKFRFLKLWMNQQGDVCADYDFLVFGDEAAAVEQTIMTVLLIHDMVDDCLPELEKAMKEQAQPEGETFLRLNLFDSEEE